MKSLKLVLIILGSAGLISLGACNNGQTASSDSNQAVSSPSGTATGSQVIKPASQTGSALMTLNAEAIPLKIGKNTLMLAVMDAKTGKPLAVKDVGVEMIMTEKEMKAMGMEGAGSAKIEVKPATSPGMFAIQTSLPFGGNWQMKVNLKDAQPTASAVFDVVVK